MSTILLFGAGKSATSLIDYLGNYCEKNNSRLLVCDADLSLARSKTNQYKCAEAISFDVNNAAKRHEIISQAAIVISMLPPALHFLVAKDCLNCSKNLLTASYLDSNVRALSDEIEAKGILFLGEMGLDPGIDHMSALRIINEIKRKGGIITSFKSHCGGLVAPEFDNNPWHYKITWNPVNVVAAGSSGAFYKEDNKIIEILYSKVFADERNTVDIPDIGPLAWYANRDSLSYIDMYHLHGVHTFIRTTLRHHSFCRGWNKVVQLDLTNKNDHEEIKNCSTFLDWFELKKQKLIDRSDKYFNHQDFFNQEFSEQAAFISLNSRDALPKPVTNSASLLQFLLEKNLAMNPGDKDMIIMLHEIEFSINGKNKKTRSCLVVKGEDKTHTAMAKTVGLPLGIAATLILENKINVSGLHIPVIPEIYEPVLARLELNGIKFREETTPI